MIMIDSHDAIDNLKKNNEMVLAYFGGGGCGVCKAAAAYNIFTIPAILALI